MAHAVSKAKRDVVAVAADLPSADRSRCWRRAAQPLGLADRRCRAGRCRGDRRGQAVRRAAAISRHHRRGARPDRRDRRRAHAAGALAIVAADLLALALLRRRARWARTSRSGSAQRFGVPLGFGGPHAAFFATRDAFKRAHAGPPRRRQRAMPPARRRCAWRCRRASSTSAARRRRATSARRRCCWR